MDIDNCAHKPCLKIGTCIDDMYKDSCIFAIGCSEKNLKLEGYSLIDR